MRPSANVNEPDRPTVPQANESGNGLSDDICGTASHKIDTQDTGQWSSEEVKGDAA
jgi:hypothetical protein